MLMKTGKIMKTKQWKNKNNKKIIIFEKSVKIMKAIETKQNNEKN